MKKASDFKVDERVVDVTTGEEAIVVAINEPGEVLYIQYLRTREVKTILNAELVSRM